MLYCNKCYFISSLTFDFIPNNDIIVKSKCRNNHYYCESLKSFNFINNDEIFFRCVNCEIKFSIGYNYCFHCNILICDECGVKHKRIKKHKIYKFPGFEVICFEHLLKFSFFCETCEINLCNKCKELHNLNHKIILLSNLLLTQNEIMNYQKKIFLFKEKLFKVKEEKKLSYIYVYLNELQILFANKILNMYFFYKQTKNICFEIINNLKKIMNSINLIEKYNNQINHIENYIYSQILNIDFSNYIVKKLFPLSDGRLIITFTYGFKIIFENTFQIHCQHFFPYLTIDYICELNNKNLMISLRNKIYLIDFYIGIESECQIIQSISCYKYTFTQIIEINNNKIIALDSFYGDIALIIKSKLGKYQIQNIYKFSTNEIYLINKNECILFRKKNNSKFISFLNLDSFEINNDIQINYSTSFSFYMFHSCCLCDENVLLISGNNCIYLINIIKKNILSVIDNKEFDSCFRLKNGKILFFIIKNEYELILWDFKNKQIEKKIILENIIIDICELKNGYFVVCLENGILKIFR